MGTINMQFQILLAATLAAAQAAPQLVAYPNGAVAPFDPANAEATAEHLKALEEAGGAANPFTIHATKVAVPVVYHHAPAFVYGRKRREADAQLVTYPNGAVAPFDPNVALATAQHYAAKAAHGSWVPLAGAANVHPPAASVYGRKKREAEPQFAFPYFAPYVYTFAPVPVTPLVGHPNGAVVPLEPEDVVKARSDHLAAVAEALKA